MSNDSPIVQALGDDSRNLHPAVRRHYTESSIDIHGTMNAIHVGRLIKPLALVSYWILKAPVPRGGQDVEMILRNRLDDSGAMLWFRTFFKNASFPVDIEFPSRTVCSGDHRIIEFIRWGVGVEADLSVDGEGGLLYEIRRYVVRVPFLGITLRFPTWLSPFGGGWTREIGETADSFRVDWEMSHPILGRTVGYRGRCRIESRP